MPPAKDRASPIEDTMASIRSPGLAEGGSVAVGVAESEGVTGDWDWLDEPVLDGDADTVLYEPERVPETVSDTVTVVVHLLTDMIGKKAHIGSKSQPQRFNHLG